MFRRRRPPFNWRQPVTWIPVWEKYEQDILGRLRDDALRRQTYPTYAEAEGRSPPQPIEVDKVEFYCKDNAETHNTDMYELLNHEDCSPILRRGQAFNFAIHFNRQFDKDTDKVKLELNLGSWKNLKKGILITLHMPTKKKFTKDSSNWDIALSNQEKTKVTLQIQIPHNAAVGAWQMRIVSQVAASDKPKTYDCKENIYIIFNPWSKNDPVYMEDHISRKEYVLNEFGKIYQGNDDEHSAITWSFGQFKDTILPACMFILEQSGLNPKLRGDPVKVVRVLSRMMNYVNKTNKGILVGNWGDDFKDGTHPSDWTGSTDIIEKYFNSKGEEPVKYGQCWVFAGIFNTVLRALGIPSRTITVFLSVHDGDTSLTSDKYLDEKGLQIEEESEAPWNYHVWNDCWMARYDLPKGYGGWQAVDGTPQEESDGRYQLGPASVVAIKRGEVGFLYDVPFVVAAVNADELTWRKVNNENIIIKVDKELAGKLILTKKAGPIYESGDADKEDITELYKYKEGTKYERLSIWNAARLLGESQLYELPPPGKDDVHFKLKGMQKVNVGQNFRAAVQIENTSKDKRKVEWLIYVYSITYTGIVAKKLKSKEGTLEIKPGQKDEVGFEVTAKEYKDKLVDQAFIKIHSYCFVKETKQIWSHDESFQLKKPALHIEVEKDLYTRMGFDIKFTFTNPLKETLENSRITFEGPGLVEPRTISLKDLGPEETMVHSVTLTPRTSGQKIIIATFTSRQLGGIRGVKHIAIED